MLQHNLSTNSIEKINRLHTEAKNARLVQQVKPQNWLKAIAQSLNSSVKHSSIKPLNDELEVSFESKIPA